MKNMKKVLGLSLAIIMVLSTVACAKKMQSVSEIPEAERNKIIEESETSRKIVDKKTLETSTEETSEEVETEENVDENYDEYQGLADDIEKETESESLSQVAPILENTESVETTVADLDTGFSLLKEDETEDCIEKHLTIEEAMATDQFKYGMTPIKWVYINPNKQIISNNKPKSSPKYAINKKAMSGEKGAFIPIYTAKTKNATDTYDARFFCFEDTTQDFLEFKFKNKTKDLEYEGKSVMDIYKDAGHEVEETNNGILIVDGEFLNVIYIKDLEKMLGIG